MNWQQTGNAAKETSLGGLVALTMLDNQQVQFARACMSGLFACICAQVVDTHVHVACMVTVKDKACTVLTCVCTSNCETMPRTAASTVMPTSHKCKGNLHRTIVIMIICIHTHCQPDHDHGMRQTPERSNAVNGLAGSVRRTGGGGMGSVWEAARPGETLWSSKCCSMLNYNLRLAARAGPVVP